MRRLRSILNSFAWRIRAWVGSDRVDAAWVRLARVYRPWVRGPIAIGVTGSGGKSTAKELIHGLLASTGPGVANPGSLNMLHQIAKVVLAMRPWHRHAVAELTEHEPGAMAANVALFRPSVALVTLRRDDHAAAFEGAAQVLAEFACLLASLPASGTAVLNADEPEIAALQQHTSARVITFGVADHAHVRAEDVDGDWPSTLSMTLVHGDERARATTQLHGRHWVPVVLGAVATALACGLSLRQCAQVLGSLPALSGRMQGLTTADGVHVVRDDYKAPYWTVAAGLDFLQRAKAPRKVAVIGSLSDFGPGVGAAKRYAQLAEQLNGLVDLALFVGPWATAALGARCHPSTRRMAFSSVLDLSTFLNAELRSGDLVWLKGTNKQDHLERLLLTRNRQVDCWRDDCRLTRSCTSCPELGRRSRPPNHGATAVRNDEAPAPEHPWQAAPPAADEWVAVGLGNAGAQYENTPHNLGAATLQALAAAEGWIWHRDTSMHVARGSLNGRPVSLLLPQVAINLTGPALRRIAERWGLAPARMVLVHDDLSLPLGTVKQRQAGSAGGHRGIDSVLVAFQSDGFCRIKVGARPSEPPASWIDHVTKPFDPSSQALANAGVEQAVARLRTLLRQAPRKAET